MLLGLAAAAVVGLLVLWLARARLIEGYALDELNRRGVPAAGRVVAAGADTLTIEDARIGAARSPDLVARRITVGFSAWNRRVTGVSLDGATLRARVEADGRIRLGTLDRLLPPPDGRPPRLPEIDLKLRDAAVEIATPFGPLRARVRGEGNPARRFDGELRLLPASLAVDDCAVTLAGGALRLSAAGRRARVAGPLALGAVACAGVRAEGGDVDLDLALADPIEAAAGRVALTLDRVAVGSAEAAQLRARCDGRTDVAIGSPARAACAWRAEADGVAVQGWRARRVVHAASLTAERGPRGAQARWATGTLALTGVAAPPSTRAAIARPLDSLGPTPLGPLETAARTATARATAAFDVVTQVEAAAGPGGVAATVDSAQLRARSGARIDIAGRAVLAGGRVLVAGPVRAQAGGGGLPTLTIEAGPGGRTARIALSAWTAGPARIEPTTLTATLGRDRVALHGPVTMSGPLGPGRVARLRVPAMALTIGAAGGSTTVALPRCMAFAADRIVQPRYTLAGPAGRLCPDDGPLLAARDGRLDGGFLVRDFRTAGTVAGTPFQLDLPAVAGRIGGTDTRAEVRLDAQPARGSAQMAGAERPFAFDRFSATARQRDDGWAFTGDFAGGRSATQAVELGGAAGVWAMDPAGRLTLREGAAFVRDPAARPRFAPLRLADATAAYLDGHMTFGARLLHAPTATGLGRVRGTYAAATGAWTAGLDLLVPFGPDLQPYQLTEAARGVIENVVGSVRLTAALRYADLRLSGPGRVQTGGLAFATAALGPVTGLKADVAFTDLPALTSEPGQSVSVATVNPGIELRNGDGSIALTGGGRVRVDSLVFPFAGGALRLRPTTLDPAVPERDFALEVEGLDVARFVQLLKIENLYATGRFDGLLPVRLTAAGGRIEGGMLKARPPGGVIRYVGPIGDDLPAAARLAFGALKALRYETLTLGVNGDIDGDIVTDLRFTGANENAVAAGGPAALPPGTPFRFNVAIRAPFRRLLGSVGGFSDARPFITQGLADPFTAPQPDRPD